MPDIRKLKQEMEEIKTLHDLGETYTEISSARIKRVRQSFDKNSTFYMTISSLYQQIVMSAAKQGHTPPDHSDKKKLLSIAVTSNQRFYGKMNLDIIEKFVTDIKQKETETLVIGKTGEEHFRSAGHIKIDQFRCFEHEFPTADEVKQLLDFADNYHKVYLYYPRFESLLRQSVEVTDITFNPYHAEVEKYEIDHIFEPELPEIFDFFRTQVREIMFMQTMLEAELARTSSRMMIMSNAQENARALAAEKRIQLNQSKRQQRNARLLELLTVLQSQNNNL